ncbi:MAG: hypothetical protein F2667_04360 [Actinobacteria bacterium]|uniref:Unannotated protein n=1 Tax=freshwater metagenome TaxID=449393 RepID=A0A6J6PJP6_9ZZZZ|nr:hypothetical protein [Actinomycetota bacterium]
MTPRPRINLRTIRKAIVAGLGAGLFAATSALGASLIDDGALGGTDIGLALGAALVAFTVTGRATWQTRNDT